MKFLVMLLIFVTHLLSQTELPAPIPGEQLIHRLGYTLSYNESHEQASWVAYELTSSEVRGTISRTDDFRQDPSVTTGSASLADYLGSGLDRGHLAPAADMKWSRKVMSESFYMSNMSPQEPGFNRGIWKKLEGKVRDWAIINGSVYVATGGILTGGLQHIGPNNVSVPKFYYKVVLDYTEPGLKGIGFILPNKKSDRDLASYAVSIDEVEERTGIDFFTFLPNGIEAKLESSFDTFQWGTPENLPLDHQSRAGATSALEHQRASQTIDQSSLRSGINANQKTIKKALRMQVQGWEYSMPRPKSAQAAWGNSDGRTTWWPGYWHNSKTGEYSRTIPRLEGNVFKGDGQERPGWRRGGSPRRPNKLEWLLSKRGGIRPR